MIRFGVIGTNWITERLINAASEIEDFQLTAVYSRSGEKAAAFAEKYGVRDTFTDLHDMANSEAIDAVYIASPNAYHAEQSILFMNHGKHVLCEKPLASNTAEVEAMISAAKRHDVLLMEAMKTTLLPNFQSIRDHLHKIGTVRRYFASFCKYSSRYDAYKQGEVLNAFKPELSNGSLMDLGVYCLYPMVVLFGEPNHVQATGVTLESGVDGEGSVLAHYDDMDAVVMHSKITTSHLPAEIQGENGSIIIDKISEPGDVTIQYHDGTQESIKQPDDQPSMYYEMKAFIDLIKMGKRESTINSYDHSKMTARVLERARQQIGLVYPADQ
ncbi:Gfo/Idh/MocA family protein [Tuberibacillus sp. Marseille-P3662]|uniref:Gfo/Idh/MocA family protein n=1 Tax=Tuberibacillus sp. Marseille-P3662 TaxID=1965358 RepID=UPI000A1C8D39|nr:Gfo/Idh/MocA family oxidoreductase [Tuberibacillus sp. Marseille-P3662]